MQNGILSRLIGVLGLTLLSFSHSPELAVAQEDPPLYIGSWGSRGYGPGQLVAPRSMAVDGEGNLYVSDGARKDLQRITPGGIFTTHLVFPYAPWDFAIDPAGFIYVVDPFSETVYRFMLNGANIGWWTRPHGNGPGQWYFPIGVGVDNEGFVWVVDANLKRVQKFTGTGTYVTGFVVSTSGESPQRIRFDLHGNIYILTSAGHVRKFDPSGTVLGEWGAVGGSDTNHPPGIAIASPHMYVSEPAFDRITKYSLDGGLVTSWTTFGMNALPASANCLAANREGRLFAAGDKNATIEIYGDIPTATRKESWAGLKLKYR